MLANQNVIELIRIPQSEQENINTFIMLRIFIDFISSHSLPPTTVIDPMLSSTSGSLITSRRWHLRTASSQDLERAEWV
jgi:hypothetical protein